MPMANPLVGGDQGLGYVSPGGDSAGSYDPSTASRRVPPNGVFGGLGVNATVGSGNLLGVHNTPLHVAGLIILGLAIVFGLRALGFRFAVTAGVGK